MKNGLESIRLLIFDLDGTLVDSAEDIAHSVNELLEDLGRPPLSTSRIRGYVGDGVRKLLERALGDASDEALDRAVDRYLPIYRRRLLDHTRPYAGVVEALETLALDRSLAVLTNKPRHESVRLLEGLDMLRYFDVVYGGDSFPERKPHPMGVGRILEELGRAPEETLFVGDSDVDLQTARRASVRFCLVRYGMGVASLRGAAADMSVDDLREIAGAMQSS